VLDPDLPPFEIPHRSIDNANRRHDELCLARAHRRHIERLRQKIPQLRRFE